jgi:hypothetical protein
MFAADFGWRPSVVVAGLERMREVLLSLFLVADLRLAQFCHLFRGRIQPYGALAAVENHGRAIGEIQGTRFNSRQGGDAK